MSLADEIAAELHRLRKGRGVNRPDLDGLVGPHLRRLTDGHDDADRWPVLVSVLDRFAARLTEDQQQAIVASLGLGAEMHRRPQLKQRREWLMDRLQVEDRTTWRRMNAAERELATLLAQELERRPGGNQPTQRDWYLARLETLLCLTATSAEAYERRLIVAMVDSLATVRAWTNVPGTPEHPQPAIDGEVLSGGRLRPREPSSGHCHEFVIELPKPLRLGETHEYLLRLRLAPGQTMRPHYILTPEYRCDLFDLRVRFDAQHLPSWIRKVDGEPVRAFECGQREAETLIPDLAGEVHVTFDRPALYVGYGVQWSA